MCQGSTEMASTKMDMTAMVSTASALTGRGITSGVITRKVSTLRATETLGCIGIVSVKKVIFILPSFSKYLSVQSACMLTLCGWMIMISLFDLQPFRLNIARKYIFIKGIKH